jgi:hypothetical protein
MVAMLVAVQGPAMADVENCFDFGDGFVQCDDDFGFFFPSSFDFGDGVTQEVGNESDTGTVSLGFSVS